MEFVQQGTWHHDTPKPGYLAKLRDHGSKAARTPKVADRISNLPDPYQTVFKRDFVDRCLQASQTYFLPMARAVNRDMTSEIASLLKRRGDELLP